MAELIDAYGRRLSYVRVSVTDRCNFRCGYCMPPEGVKCMDHGEILRYEDISFLCDVFWELGVRKFRFTGGEPLVRKDMVPFLAQLKKNCPDMKIAITTNASLLDRYAEDLARIGLNSLNISLDTVDPEKFAGITRIGRLDQVIKGIRAAVRVGISNIKMNTVLIKGFNDREVPELLNFARSEGLLLRLIEFMPLEEGLWNEENFISGGEMLKTLPDAEAWKAEKKHSEEEGPARYYVNEKSGDRIGVIEAVSNHFCDTCNRVRVSASGDLRMCLFADTEVPLRDKIRERDRNGLRDLIIAGAKEKPRCWNDVRSGKRHMSQIGG